MTKVELKKEVERLQSEVFEMCNCTGAREHLDVDQCILHVKQTLNKWRLDGHKPHEGPCYPGCGEPK